MFPQQLRDRLRQNLAPLAMTAAGSVQRYDRRPMPFSPVPHPLAGKSPCSGRCQNRIRFTHRAVAFFQLRARYGTRGIELHDEADGPPILPEERLTLSDG